MFRRIQPLVRDCTHSILMPVDTTLETGVVERSFVDASSITLPPAENYDLGVLLKAGVRLEQVNCKLISSSKASIVLPSDEPETNDDNITKEN